MRTKVLTLGLACLLMVGSAFSAEKRHIKSWQEFFPDPVEKIYIFMKDGIIFQYSSRDKVMINMNIGMLEKRLKKFKDKNYSIREIATIIHNHRRKNYFTHADYRQYEMLKKYGFDGQFLMYCHRTNKVYDIEGKEKSK